MTEGEKRRISKETGPVKKEIPIEEVIKMKVNEADPSVREQLRETLEEFREVFPDRYHMGLRPRGLLTMRLIRRQELRHRTKAHTG